MKQFIHTLRSFQFGWKIKKLSLNVAKTQIMTLGSSNGLQKHHMDNGDPASNLHMSEENLGMIGARKCLCIKVDSVLKGRECKFPEQWASLNML